MKENFKRWLDTPWTNRSYLKGCVVVLIIYGIMCAAYAIWWYIDEIKDYFKRINPFKKKTVITEDYES